MRIPQVLLAALLAGSPVCLVGCAAAQPARSASLPSQRPATPWEKAKEAIERGDTQAARFNATQMLKENRDPKAWSYGNVVHEANQILGLAALQEGKVAEAKRYLLAAGATPGSPQLSSFGPHMVLAQKLLERGEGGTVIQYLDLVARFLAHTSKQDLQRFEKKKPGSAAVIRRMNQEWQREIDEWKRRIRAGERPELNNSGGLF